MLDIFSQFLSFLELIQNCLSETTQVNAESLEHILFTQPGMRYCQAQALVHSLMKDSLFASSSEVERKLAINKILEDVRGRMMEEIVPLETSKSLPRTKRAFKLLLSRGEFDMVIYDSETNTCELYEIKHSRQIVPEQYHVLLDEERCIETERRFGKITKRSVIYCGEDYKTKDNIRYQNVENYLNSL